MKTVLKAMMAFAMVLTIGAPARSQAPDTGTGTVQGHANDEVGTPIRDGEVKLTKDMSAAPDKRVYQYTFPTDAQGNYKGEDIAPGTYNAVLFRQGKSVDFISDPKDVNQALPQTWKAGEAKTLDFDMSRPEFLKTLTPERRKEIEDFRAKNAAATAANKGIAQLNATLKTVSADLAAAKPSYGDVSQDVASMKQATDAKPDESILWITYGQTLSAQGDHLARADAQQHKALSSDDEAMKDYNDAVDAFKKGIDLNAASKKPVPVDQASAWNGSGNILAKQGKLPEAQAAYESAVKLDPSHAGMYYNNEAAVMFNAGQSDGALQAADKAIAVDPNAANAYFVKGQVLIGKSTMDPKTNKLVPPPGCVDAYQKYLQLEPNGTNAASVRSVLQELNVTIDTKYKAGKK